MTSIPSHLLPSSENSRSEKQTIHQVYPSTRSPSLYLNKNNEPTQDCETGSRCPHRRACGNHNTNKSCARRLIVPIIVTLIALGALFIALLSLNGGDGGLLSGWTSLDLGSIIRRAGETAVNAAPAPDTGSGPVVNKKLYLIIIFVGLILVVFAGIMLSAWCCKGIFQNPLCCPCYLCACCGGLACLECIACGLCAEGFEQVAQDG